MRAKPAITVITPTYNRHCLARAVASVLSQTHKDFEHIVVDDGSTDGTLETLRALRDPRLILIRLPERKGANFARNVGIDAARADIVTFLDSDDVFLPSRLQETLRRFEADSKLELLLSSFVTVRGSRQTVSANRQCRVDGHTLEMALALQAIFVASSAITARRSALVEIGSFDTEIQRLQDREMLFRFAQRCGALLSEKIDWVKHRSDDSISLQSAGHIHAYSILLGKHPHLREKYPGAIRYATASQLVHALKKLHFAEAISSFRVNRSSSAMGYSLPQLLLSLILDRSHRSALRVELRARAKPVSGSVRSQEAP